MDTSNVSDIEGSILHRRARCARQLPSKSHAHGTTIEWQIDDSTDRGWQPTLYTHGLAMVFIIKGPQRKNENAIINSNTTTKVKQCIVHDRNYNSSTPRTTPHMSKAKRHTHCILHTTHTTHTAHCTSHTAYYTPHTARHATHCIDDQACQHTKWM